MDVTRGSSPKEASLEHFRLGRDRVRRDPPARLRAHVVVYTGYRMRAAPFVRRATFPSTTVTMCLNWGAALSLTSERDPSTSGSGWEAMLGLQTGPVISHTGGTGYGVQIELTALGAFTLFSMPLRHLADSMIHPADVLGRGWGADLTERLAEASGWRRRWEILDEVISLRIADSRCWPSPVLCEAWALLRDRHGSLSVGQLAEATGRSRRRLEILFAEQIGLAPKPAARVLRFQKALTALRTPRRNCAEVAAASGYHDQAHLAREFRALAGMTPTALQKLAPHGMQEGTSSLTSVPLPHGCPAPGRRPGLSGKSYSCAVPGEEEHARGTEAVQRVGRWLEGTMRV